MTSTPPSPTQFVPHFAIVVPRSCALGLCTIAAVWVGTCACFQKDARFLAAITLAAAAVLVAQFSILAWAGRRLERTLKTAGDRVKPADDFFAEFAWTAVVLTLSTAVVVGPFGLIAAASALQVALEDLLVRCLLPFGVAQLVFALSTFISVRGSLRRSAVEMGMPTFASPRSSLVRILVGLTFTVPIPLAVLLVIAASHELYSEEARQYQTERLSRTSRAVLSFDGAPVDAKTLAQLTLFDRYRTVLRDENSVKADDHLLSAPELARITAWASPSSKVGLEADLALSALPLPITFGLVLTTLLLAAFAAAYVFSVMTRARRQLTARLDALPERLVRTPFDSPFQELAYFDELLSRLKERFDEMRQRQRRSIETGRKDRELKAQFFAGMSHDLRSPLNSIIGFTDLLLGGIEGELTPEQKRAVLSVSVESEKLMSLIADILDTSKLDAGRFDLERAWVPPVEIISGCTAEARRMLGSKAIEITPAVQAGLSPVFVDKSRIQQALIGLITRATQNASRGAFRIKAWSGRTVSGTQMLRIDIIDVAVTLSATERLLITEALSSTASIPSRSGTGALGLGIALARDLIHLHGGDLVVHRGGATVFSVVLPLDESKS